MTGNHAYIRAIVIDCRDPERLAVFWSELLGSTVASRTGPYVWLTRGDGPVLGFQRVDEPTPGKNRTHVDLAFPDPAAGPEQARRRETPSGSVPGARSWRGGRRLSTRWRSGTYRAAEAA